MSISNEYLRQLMERVVKRNPAEPEFHQAVSEVLASLSARCWRPCPRWWTRTLHISARA